MLVLLQLLQQLLHVGFDCIIFHGYLSGCVLFTLQFILSLVEFSRQLLTLARRY